MVKFILVFFLLSETVFCIVTFLLAMVKFLIRSNLRGQGFILVHCLRWYNLQWSGWVVSGNPYLIISQWNRKQSWDRKQGWATNLSACSQWPNSYNKSLPSNGSTTPPNSTSSVQILNLIVNTLYSLHNRQGDFSFYALTVQSLSLNHKQSRQINRRKRL